MHKVIGADGNLKLQSDVISLPPTNDSTGVGTSAGRRELLRDSLRKSMSAKRAADRLKRLEKENFGRDDTEPMGKR